jgi:hypothetical protein
MRSTTVTRRAGTDHRSCSGGPAPGPRSMLPSRLCGSLPADPSLTPTGPHEPPSGQPRSPCFTLHPGANRLLLAPTDLMVGVLSACYTRRPQGVTHGQSRCTVLSCVALEDESPVQGAPHRGLVVHHEHSHVSSISVLTGDDEKLSGASHVARSVQSISIRLPS